MSKPPPKTLPSLRREVLRIAKLADIPDQELFCDSVCDTVKMIWQVDRRAVGSKPDTALHKAAKAARNLNEAFCSLEKEDRAWVDRIAARHPWLSQEERLSGAKELFQIDELEQTVWLLGFLFNSAIGKHFPPMPGMTGLRGKQGRSEGSVKDAVFQGFVFNILVCATVAGGDLTMDKNQQTGSLPAALEILRPHLPKGVVPNVLPLGTIQKIKTKHSKARRASLGLPAK
jgi:hypothetical protein